MEAERDSLPGDLRRGATFVLASPSSRASKSNQLSGRFDGPAVSLSATLPPGLNRVK
jgi:hypothetical protein